MCIMLLETIMDIRSIIQLVYLLFVIRSNAEKLSMACFGTPGLGCTQHSLDCGEEEIAILDAFYSQHSKCTGDISVCNNVDFDENDINRWGEFDKSEAEDLYRKCSLNGSCHYNAPRRLPFYFSVVKYICIKETVNICDAKGTFDDNISLVWNKTKALIEDTTCSCRISSKTNKPAAVFSLDMRPRSQCNKLSITADINCTKPIQYHLLTNITRPIVLEQVNVLDILWIRIHGPSEVNCTRNIISTTKSSTQNSQSSTPTADAVKDKGKAGAIAGGVTGVVVVCLIVVAVLIWFKFVRNKKKVQKPEGGKDNYVSAGSLSSNAVQGSARDQRTGNNYDYATIQDRANPVGHARNDYDLADKPRTAKEGTATVEDDYNHINHNAPQSAQSSGYATAVSAAAAVKKLSTSHSVEDDYNHLGVGKPNVVSSDYDTTVCEDDYNHLGAGKPNVVSSDYDTTVSAAKAVENRDCEDDYDHFKRTEDRVIDSPYDTANHHGNAK